MSTEKKSSKANGARRRGAEILSRNNCKTGTVDVEEWGGKIPIRELGAREREEYERELARVASSGEVDASIAVQAAQKLRIPVVIMGCLDPDDPAQPLFDADDAEALAEQPARVIQKVFLSISKLSGLTPADEAEAIEEKRDFSEETPEGVSSSESPSTGAAARSVN